MKHFVERLCSVTLLVLLSGCSPPDSTVFAPGFSEEHFARVAEGMERSEVTALLGEPLASVPATVGEVWVYGDSNEGQGVAITGPAVFFSENAEAVRVYGVRGAAVGMTGDQVRTQAGEPAEIRKLRSATVLQYSRPGEEGRFRGRAIGLDSKNKVVEIFEHTSWE